MIPFHFNIGSVRIDIWELVFLVGAIAGYFVLRAAFRSVGTNRPRFLGLKYAFTIYACVLAAQFFSYAFDLGTSLRPPPGQHWFNYYLNPLAGAKTLYGAIIALPISVWIVSIFSPRLKFAVALDAWTPTILTVLTGARFACLAQGCCYGVLHDRFGMSFPHGAVVYFKQLREGLIATGAEWSIPTFPTQLVSAIVLTGLTVWAFSALRHRRRNLFVPAMLAYSIFRFLIEFVRDDPVRNFFGPLSASQWIAAAVILICGAIVVTSFTARKSSISREQVRRCDRGRSYEHG